MCWISVNDQLPAPGERVDVWIDNRRVTDVLFDPEWGSKIVGVAEQRFIVAYEIDDLDINVVTHWRYPPEPPVRGA